MISANLSVTIPHRAGDQYLPAFAHCNPIDTAAPDIIHPIILQQQQTLHITNSYVRFGQGLGQGVEANINVTCKLRAGC